VSEGFVELALGLVATKSKIALQFRPGYHAISMISFVLYLHRSFLSKSKRLNLKAIKVLFKL
jgi:hypothetical protein